MLRARGSILPILLICPLAACERRDPAPAPDARTPAIGATPSTGKPYLAGGSLRGLDRLPVQTIAGAERLDLFAAAYPEISLASPTVTRDDEVLTAEPALAVRLADRVLLFVRHVNTEDCHACTGGTSVFVFDRTGKQVTGAFPFSLPGTDWGLAEPVVLFTLPNGQPAVSTTLGGVAQGCAVSYAEFFELGAAGPRKVARIQVMYDDTNGLGADSVALQGVEAAGLDHLRARWAGHHQEADGSRTPIAEERTIALGREEPWASSWPDLC